MVTDIKSNYTSPAGKEYTFAAGRFAGIHPASRILDIGCGFGEGVCTIVQEFRCKAVAVDIIKDNITTAHAAAVEKKLSHLIEFHNIDITKGSFPGQQFDLILAEGGIISFIGRSQAFELVKPWLLPRGWLAFSDLILLTQRSRIPPEVLSIFKDEEYQYESEESYRQKVEAAGFSQQFICLVPPSGWDNYYAHMARRLEDEDGFFADINVKYAFHKQIDVFYRLEALRYVGYMVCFVRRKK
ncbi:MAG: methyltransferase domain-containing protein [Chitinivibrionales bacterium]|nr:methyltransferase domain-containing protein [Chitinivibrionales bacterium]